MDNVCLTGCMEGGWGSLERDRRHFSSLIPGQQYFDKMLRSFGNIARYSPSKSMNAWSSHKACTANIATRVSGKAAHSFDCFSWFLVFEDEFPKKQKWTNSHHGSSWQLGQESVRWLQHGTRSTTVTRKLWDFRRKNLTDGPTNLYLVHLDKYCQFLMKSQTVVRLTKFYHTCLECLL